MAVEDENVTLLSISNISNTNISTESNTNLNRNGIKEDTQSQLLCETKPSPQQQFFENEPLFLHMCQNNFTLLEQIQYIRPVCKEWRRIIAEQPNIEVNLRLSSSPEFLRKTIPI